VARAALRPGRRTISAPRSPAEDGTHIRRCDKLPIIVNSERLSEDGEMLRDGDTIQMGQTTFRFKVV
jgi:hypothetical protein